jgi:hypothetical protein
LSSIVRPRLRVVVAAALIVARTAAGFVVRSVAVLVVVVVVVVPISLVRRNFNLDSKALSGVLDDLRVIVCGVLGDLATLLGTRPVRLRGLGGRSRLGVSAGLGLLAFALAVLGDSNFNSESSNINIDVLSVSGIIRV